MNPIRKATPADVSRIAEILVFTKRMNYRAIFQDDTVSFGDLQVLPVARKYLDDPVLLGQTWVYDDGLIKGLIEIRENEIETLYVDHFFQNEGIGGRLIDFAVEHFGVDYAWVLEKNHRVMPFYARHGFKYYGTRKPEAGTSEFIIMVERR